MAYPLSRKIFYPWLRRRIVSLNGVEHIPAFGPVIFVSNHVGDHDPLLLGAVIIMHTGARKVHAVSKWRILQFPLWRKWLGVVPLYPDRSRTFARLVELVSDGEQVLMYPEGGVNVKPVINRAKTGVVRLALQTRVPVIPVGLERTSAPPKTGVGFVLEILYARLRITFGPPVDLSVWYGTPVDGALLAEAHRKIMTTVATLAHKTYEPQ